MGEARRRQISDAAFRDMHTECAYCGEPSTTIDHFPPRAFFHNNIWPEGFRFPSCSECNGKTRIDELVVSALARVGLVDSPSDTKTLELLKAVKNNYPDVMGEWFTEVSRNRLRKSLRKGFGDAQGDEMRRQGYSAFHYGDRTHTCLCNFGDKLIRSLYFKHVGKRVDGRAFCKPQSLIDQREHIEAALALAPMLELTSRNRRSLSDQFAYRYALNADDSAFFLVAQIGNQLGFIGHGLSSKFVRLMESEPQGLSLVEEFYRIP